MSGILPFTQKLWCSHGVVDHRGVSCLHFIPSCNHRETGHPQTVFGCCFDQAWDAIPAILQLTKSMRLILRDRPLRDGPGESKLALSSDVTKRFAPFGGTGRASTDASTGPEVDRFACARSACRNGDRAPMRSTSPGRTDRRTGPAKGRRWRSGLRVNEARSGDGANTGGSG